MANPKLDPEIERLVRVYLKQGLSERKIIPILLRDHGKRVSKGSIQNISHRPPHTPPVRGNKKTGALHWREWTGPMRGMQALKRKASYSQDHAEINLGNGDEPVALASFSDQHIGSWGTDYDALTRLTDELLSTPNLYIAMLGDYGQYSIKLRSVLEVADNLIPPEQQTDFIDSWFNDIWHKVAFATWDNHAVERQEKQAGESSIKRLLSRKVTYFNGIGHVDVTVGSQTYRGCVSHKFRGNSLLNPVHSIQRYMRFEGTDREWGMAGDTHTAGMLKYTDGDKVRVAVNAGSIQSNSGFGKRYFSLTTHPVYPIAVFHPREHLITPFWSIREWLEAKN